MEVEIIVIIRKVKGEVEETGEAEVKAREGVEDEVMEGVEDEVVEEAEDGRKVGDEAAPEEGGVGDPTMPEMMSKR